VLDTKQELDLVLKNKEVKIGILINVFMRIKDFKSFLNVAQEITS
jgi:hypothetical protein